MYGQLVESSRSTGGWLSALEIVSQPGHRRPQRAVPAEGDGVVAPFDYLFKNRGGREQTRPDVELFDRLIEAAEIPAGHGRDEAGVAPRSQIEGIGPRSCFARALEGRLQRAGDDGGKRDRLCLMNVNPRQPWAVIERPSQRFDPVPQLAEPVDLTRRDTGRPQLEGSVDL